jgi:hypothetical protein
MIKKVMKKVTNTIYLVGFHTQESRGSTLLKVIGIIIALPFIVIIALIILVYNPLPTTDEMRDLYYQNRGAWEARTEAIQEAKAKNEDFGKKKDETLGYYTYSTGGDPFSAGGDLFGILYYTTSSGIGVGTYGTGLAYLGREPQDIYPNLEVMKEEASKVEGFWGYGHIEGNWYYFLWEAD